MSAYIAIPTDHVGEFLSDIKKKSDRIMNYFLVGFFAAGLLLAFYYDTWLVAIAVGGMSLIAYYSAKLAMPDRTFINMC